MDSRMPLQANQTNTQNVQFNNFYRFPSTCISFVPSSAEAFATRKKLHFYTLTRPRLMTNKKNFVAIEQKKNENKPRRNFTQSKSRFKFSLKIIFLFFNL